MELSSTGGLFKQDLEIHKERETLYLLYLFLSWHIIYSTPFSLVYSAFLPLFLEDSHALSLQACMTVILIIHRDEFLCL